MLRRIAALKWMILLAFACVAGILWWSDVLHRYQASRKRGQGLAALNARDWPHALEDMQQAHMLRPLDPDHDRDYQQTEAAWLDTLTKEGASLSPEEARAHLLQVQPMAQLVLAGGASDEFKALLQRTSDAAIREVESNLVSAEQAAQAGNYAVAYKLIEDMRLYSALAPDFEETVNHIEIAEVHDAMARAKDLVAQNDYPGAYAVLDAVQTKALLVPEFKPLVLGIHKAQVRHEIAQAMSLAGRNDYLAALTALVAAGKHQLLPDEIEAARENVVARGELHSVHALIAALRDGQAESAATALATYASLAGITPGTDARTLMACSDLPSFLTALEDLHIRARAEAERTNHLDLVMVQALRSHFSDAAGVRQFLGSHYLEWARDLLSKGKPGLAIYLNGIAIGEGLPVDYKTVLAAVTLLGKEIGLTVAFLPTDATGKAPVLPSDAPVAAMKALAAHYGGSAVQVGVAPTAEEANSPLVIRTKISRLTASDEPTTVQRSVQYQSGTEMVPNPDYGALLNRVRQADYELEQGRAMDAQNQQQAQALAANNNMGAFGQSMAVAASATSSVALISMQHTSDQLHDQLNQTPETVQHAVYAAEPYDEITHDITYTGSFSAVLEVQGVPNDSVHRWTASKVVTVEEVAGNEARGVPVKRPSYPDPGSIAQELSTELSRKVQADQASLGGELYQGAWKVLNQRFDDARTPAAMRIDQLWGLTEIFRGHGIMLKNLDSLEQAVRETLGLDPSRT